MANISYEAFLPDVAPHIEGAPRPVILKAIRDAVIDFCDETGIIVRDIEVTAVEAGAIEFDLDVPSTERVSSVQYLTDGNAGPEIPRDFYALNGNTVIFRTPLPSDMQIAARVSTKPKRSSTGCDNLLYEDWLPGIIAGSLTILRGMIGREWADSGAMELHLLELRKQMTKAKHRMRSKRQYGLGTASQRSFE